MSEHESLVAEGIAPRKRGENPGSSPGGFTSLITRSMTRDQWRDKLTDFDEFGRWCHWCLARAPLGDQLDHESNCPLAETQEADAVDDLMAALSAAGDAIRRAVSQIDCMTQEEE